MPAKLIVVAHDIRSSFNVGAIFRTCACFGVSKLILSGITPYPEVPTDTRLPHLRQKISQRIAKTALGSIELVLFEYVEDITITLSKYSSQGWQIAALEQHPGSQDLPDFSIARTKTVLVVGNEVDGVDRNILAAADTVLEIPMPGGKESLNVAVATGIAIYELTKAVKTKA